MLLPKRTTFKSGRKYPKNKRQFLCGLGALDSFGKVCHASQMGASCGHLTQEIMVNSNLVHLKMLFVLLHPPREHHTYKSAHAKGWSNKGDLSQIIKISISNSPYHLNWNWTVGFFICQMWTCQQGKWQQDLELTQSLLTPQALTCISNALDSGGGPWPLLPHPQIASPSGNSVGLVIWLHGSYIWHSWSKGLKNLSSPS